VREVTGRQKDRHTDTGDFIICPMLCYSNGTDKKSENPVMDIFIVPPWVGIMSTGDSYSHI